MPYRKSSQFRSSPVPVLVERHTVKVMRSIPIDQSKVRVLAAGAATPATNPDGTPRVSRDGRPLSNLPVLLLAEGSRPEAATVRIPGAIPAFAELTPLRFTDFVAWYWTLDNGRSGISLTASAVQPEAPRPAQSGAR